MQEEPASPWWGGWGRIASCGIKLSAGEGHATAEPACNRWPCQLAFEVKHALVWQCGCSVIQDCGLGLLKLFVKKKSIQNPFRKSFSLDFSYHLVLSQFDESYNMNINCSLQAKYVENSSSWHAFWELWAKWESPSQHQEGILMSSDNEKEC